MHHVTARNLTLFQLASVVSALGAAGVPESAIEMVTEIGQAIGKVESVEPHTAAPAHATPPAPHISPTPPHPAPHT